MEHASGCHAGAVHFAADVFSHLEWINETMKLKGGDCWGCSKADAWETCLQCGRNEFNVKKPELPKYISTNFKLLTTTTTTLGKYYCFRNHFIVLSHF